MAATSAAMTAIRVRQSSTSWTGADSPSPSFRRPGLALRPSCSTPKSILNLLRGACAEGDCQASRGRMVSLFGYDLWALVLGLAAGLACGFLNTAASSGSVVSLPILLMVGLDPVTANATNRIPVLIGALAATWSFHQKKSMLWGLAVKVSLPIAIGGVIGARLA